MHESKHNKRQPVAYDSMIHTYDNQSRAGIFLKDAHIKSVPETRAVCAEHNPWGMSMSHTRNPVPNILSIVQVCISTTRKNKNERMNTHANDQQRPTMISAAHMLATGRFRRACLPINEAESRAGRTVTAGRRVKKKKKAVRTACAWESDMLSGGFADDGANLEQIARARPSKVPYE
jgi:hypothetical protein